jgi:hypothetical protein
MSLISSTRDLAASSPAWASHHSSAEAEGGRPGGAAEAGGLEGAGHGHGEPTPQGGDRLERLQSLATLALARSGERLAHYAEVHGLHQGLPSAASTGRAAPG